MFGTQCSALPPAPCSSTNAGAVSGPLIRMKVGPYAVSTVVVVEGTGHRLALASYDAKTSRFASADRNGWCGESNPFEPDERATAKTTSKATIAATTTPQPTSE